MTLEAGTRLGPYEIVELRGRGGMGEVYRARDTRLGRDVAIKVLAEELSGDETYRRRLEREARTISQLQHPNVCMLLDIGSEDGTEFLVMEYLEGETLDARLAGGPLPVDVLLGVGRQIAEAVEAAHRARVVHRDLKPGNVMLTGSGVKVLDFGLAQGVAPADSSPNALTELAITGEGSILGTMPYMAPEQLQGAAADVRTDVWALGCILYEMATGERPFGGTTQASLIGAIMQAEPPPPSRRRAVAPERLDRVVQRCLEKSPERRWQSARDVGLELEWIESEMRGTGLATTGRAQAAGTGGPKVVIVLPFANRSSDPDNEYFSDGLTEEVIADLSRVAALRVISRNSAMALKGTAKSTAELAAELGVTHLVTGAVRRAGNALRVTAELVEAATDAPVWSDKYAGSAEDVFAIQEEISRKIVAALEVRLSDTEARRIAERPIESPVAYDAYLRARQHMYHWSPDSSSRALKLVDEALAIVGDNPLLLATKGQIHWIGANSLLEPADGALQHAAELAERALALDPGSARGMMVRGLVAGLRGQVERALADLREAYRLEPGDPNVVAELCRFANAAGLRTQGGLVEEAVRIDPLTPITHLVVSTYGSVNGLFERSAAACRRVFEMLPEVTFLHGFAAWQLAEAGYRDEGAEMLARAAEALAGTAAGAWARFQHCALIGDEAGADALAAELESVAVDHMARYLAAGHALLGRTDDAVRWVGRAIDAGFINYPCLSEHDPFLGPVRSEPEFERLMAELRPRWEAVVAWEREQGLEAR